MLTFLLFRKVFKWIFRLILAFIAISLLWVVSYRFFNPPTTALIQSREREYGTEALQVWVDYDQISDNLKLAVICGEDQRFKDHSGFDFKAIEKAIQHNIKSDKKRGASTISQQTAKNVFLWESRSWIRKGLEVWFTVLIELVWGKERILEIYLNEAEMGKGIFGIEAASRKYFQKSASKLTRAEAAMIASSLPNPKRYTVKPISTYVARKYPWVIRQMNNLEDDPDIVRLVNSHP